MSERHLEMGNMRILIIISIFAFLSTPVWASAEESSVVCGKLISQEDKNTITCTPSSNPQNITFVIKLESSDPGMLAPKKIIVKKNGATIQELQPDSEIQINAADENWHIGLLIGIIDLKDFNFDGYPDLQFTTSTGNANATFSYWLYDPQTGLFIRRGDLDEKLSGYEINTDIKTKTVRAYSRVSCCENIETIYQWKGDQLLLKEQVDHGDISFVLDNDQNPPSNPDSSFGGSICATKTDHYNDKELLISTEISASNECDDDGATTKFLESCLQLSRMREYLLSKPQRYSIQDIFTNNELTGLYITYHSAVSPQIYQ
jgi:hypothetical protein